MSEEDHFPSSEDEFEGIVPEEIRKAATLTAVPAKSKLKYTAAYNAFKKWRREKGSNSFCEDVFLAYFLELSKKYVQPSLWALYSMLKCTLNTFNNIDIRKYERLIAFLKQNAVGYVPKKALVFTSEDITHFLEQAPDDKYLALKVALIFGIAGCMRRAEFVQLTEKDVIVNDNCELFVKITKTKNNVPRSFIIAEPLFHFCLNYMNTRRDPCSKDNFFLRYSKGKCSQQSMGINTFGGLPKAVATFLKLPNPELYTGHSFRRSSATLLIDAGAEITELMRHGGWKSSTVASGYIADSINNKRKICAKISSNIQVKKRFSSTENKSGDVTQVNSPQVSNSSAKSSHSLNKENDSSICNSLEVLVGSPEPSCSFVNQDVSTRPKISMISNEVLVPKSKKIQGAQLFKLQSSEVIIAQTKNYECGTASHIPSHEPQRNGTIRSDESSHRSVGSHGSNKDACVQTDFPVDDTQCKAIHFEIREPKLPVYHDPDIGLHVKGLTDEIVNNFTFNNCNVTIRVEKS